MKTEADLNQQPEFKIPEGYVSDSQLVVPSLMPFLSEDNLAREVFKRNLRQPEQNKKKVAQKQIEEEFGSSIFIDTAKLLEEWSYIVRDENNQDALICPKELVLPAIFKYFHEVNQLTIESRGQTDGNEIVVPVLGKPRSLIQAFNVYNRNYETLSKQILGWGNLLIDLGLTFD